MIDLVGGWKWRHTTASSRLEGVVSKKWTPICWRFQPFLRLFEQMPNIHVLSYGLDILTAEFIKHGQIAMGFLFGFFTLIIGRDVYGKTFFKQRLHQELG